MELAYKKTGSGDPLIIIHGLYGSSDNWLSVAREFEATNEVYLIDQRNHGDSPHSNIHTYDDMARDLMVFMHHHSISAASIIGHSMGGKTAAYFAAQYPEMVRKLIIVDIGIKAYSLNSLQKESAFSHQNIIDTLLAIHPSEYSNRTEISDKMMESIPSQQIVMFLLKNLKRTGDTFAWKLNIKALKDNLQHIFDGLDPSQVKNSNMLEDLPVLFIKGEKSNYLQTQDLAEIHKIFPTAKMQTIAEAGHWVHAEKFNEFVEVTKNFLEN